MRMCSRVALLLALLPGTGCVAGYRLMVSPTIDTEGHVGGLASADLTVGAYQGDGRAIQARGGLAFGGEGSPGAFTASPHVGLEYLALAPAGGVAWRGGVAARLHMAFAGREDEYARAGVGLSGAVLPVLDDAKEQYEHVGVAFEALLTGDPSGSAGAHGLFLLGPVYEANFVTRGEGQH
jgi:hypothetical protein